MDLRDTASPSWARVSSKANIRLRTWIEAEAVESLIGVFLSENPFWKMGSLLNRRNNPGLGVSFRVPFVRIEEFPDVYEEYVDRWCSPRACLALALVSLVVGRKAVCRGSGANFWRGDGCDSGLLRHCSVGRICGGTARQAMGRGR